MTLTQARTILGLSENFTIQELKSQYRKKVLIAHPDRNGGESQKFLLVQQAFDVLSNFKENISTQLHSQNRQKARPNQDIYAQRRSAEQAYKEKAHYYYQRKRVRREESLDDIKTNIRYFVFTVLMLIAFSLMLMISIVLGPFGVILFLILMSAILYRMDFKKFKL